MSEETKSKSKSPKKTSDIKQYQKDYRNKHKDKIKEKIKACNEKNRDRFKCELCEFICAYKSQLKIHNLTDKHLSNMEREKQGLPVRKAIKYGPRKK